MPTIKTIRDLHKEWKQTHPNSKPFLTIEAKSRNQLYNTKEWRNLSATLRQENPLCELCSLEDIINPTQEIHHAIKFNSLPNERLKRLLLLDQDNLLCLCRACHHSIHENPENLSNRQRQYILDKKEAVYNKYLDEGTIIKYTNDINNSIMYMR